MLTHKLKISAHSVKKLTKPKQFGSRVAWRGTTLAARGEIRCNRVERSHMSRRLDLKRVYEPAAHSDGKRVLVERLWPRGISKSKAAIDVWLKEISPSPELRKWFAHDPAKWNEFKKRYRAELRVNRDAVEQLRKLIKDGPVTLVYAARDEQQNSARLVKNFIERSK
jgi:uncharacterized protein YeaO (DUF488 family)